MLCEPAHQLSLSFSSGTFFEPSLAFRRDHATFSDAYTYILVHDKTMWARQHTDTLTFMNRIKREIVLFSSFLIVCEQLDAGALMFTHVVVT